MENIKFKKLLSQKRSTKKVTVNTKSVLSFLGTFFAGFILSQGSVFESIYPFGLALISSTNGIYSFYALLGTSLGLIFTHSGILFFRYLVCAVSLCLVKTRLFGPYSKFGGMWLLNTVVDFFVCTLTATAVVLPQNGGLEEILQYTIEAVFISLTSIFYSKSFSSVFKEEKIFTSSHLPYLYISFSTIIATAANFEIYGFTPAILLSAFSICVMSYILAETGGGITSVCCAVAIAGSFADGYNVFPMAISGIIAGILSPFGKIVTALSFLLSFSTMNLFLNEINAYENIITTLIGCLVFIFIPEKFYKNLQHCFRRNRTSLGENAYRQEVSSKLKQASNAISAINTSMIKVSENLKKIDSNSNSSVFCRVKDDVCAKCENNEICWQNSFQYTLRAFEEMSKNYHDEKPYFATAFGKLFLSKCKRQKELQKSLTQNFKRQDETVREEIRQNEKRLIFSDQTRFMCDILHDFSEDFSQVTLVDNDLSRRIKEIFTSFSIVCSKVFCIIDTHGNMTIKAHCKVLETDADRKNLKKQIEETALRKFHDAQIEFTDNETIAVYKQKPYLQLKLGKIQLSSEDSPICGDCFREFSDQFSNRTLILSDGMGTGGRAAVDAALCAEYFSSLVQNSISYDNALKIINSVLDLKSTNESLATIDVARFNLFSGKVEFYKAGAAVSFVRKNGKCQIIESASLPAGILRDVSFAKEKVMLSKGDIVVMVSDGVTGNSIDWIIEEIENFSCSNPDILAQKIAGTVCDKNKGNKRDDITVVAGIMTA